MPKSKKIKWQSCLTFLFIVFLFSLIAATIFVFIKIQTDVNILFGSPDESLSGTKKILYSSKLFIAGDKLFMNQNDLTEDYFFEIIPGEAVGQISYRLKTNDLIIDQEIFKDYLIYKGYDRKIQSGYFRIEPEMNGIQIAEKITSLVPDKVRFNILPGWRAEEIAAILPQSGIGIDSEEFLMMVQSPSSEWVLEGYENFENLEGFLYPGEYLIDREVSTGDFINNFLKTFDENLTADIYQALASKNLTIQEAVILASIVQREAVQLEEMPLIASVFLNRYNIGMKLDSDPTVQYAVGYNVNQASWWTNPLTLEDLKTDSVFNTYLYAGLPPHPICNPSLNAIRAVAFAIDSPYYYFRATCDGSGFHNFSESYEEHLSKGCP